jgi:BirA family biotin operon repressor/biotin-[acetyl-CoA-carboxylase] ligase
MRRAYGSPGGSVVTGRDLLFPVTGRTFVGKRILHLEEIDSTNSFLLKDEILLGQDGLVVYADRQTKGRGRFNRAWETGREGHLFCSLVIRPGLSFDEVSSLTLLIGLAVYRVLDAFAIENLGIKWPNDVVVNGKKLCGILCEARKLSDEIVVVAGIGMNLCGDERQFSADLRHRVTTLEKVCRIPISREQMLERVLDAVDHILLEAQGHGMEHLFRQWERCASCLGRDVRVEYSGGEYHGSIHGLSRTGGLLVRTDSGEILHAVSGEVRYED